MLSPFPPSTTAATAASAACSDIEAASHESNSRRRKVAALARASAEAITREACRGQQPPSSSFFPASYSFFDIAFKVSALGAAAGRGRREVALH